MGDAISLTTATIEDLLPRDAYTKAVNECGYSIKLNADEKAANTNVEALEKAFQRKNIGKFGKEQKAAAALKLLDTWGANPKSVPDETLKKSEALFTAINQRF